MPIPTCTADRLERSPILATTRIPAWVLWRGRVQWFICGPGPQAMHPCSAADYTGRAPKMTAREKRIAEKALAILEANHRDNNDIGPKEIQRIVTGASGS